MQTFFVEIKCALGRTYEAASALAEAEIASEIYSIAGDFDILAKFYVESDVDIGHFVGQKVQVIPGIVDTRTLIAFRAFSRIAFSRKARISDALRRLHRSARFRRRRGRGRANLPVRRFAAAPLPRLLGKADESCAADARLADAVQQELRRRVRRDDCDRDRRKG